MKFLIYGAGVIGSIFAVKLANSGHDVTVLARNERYHQIKKDGIILYNSKTRGEEAGKVKVIRQLEADMIFDYVLVVMQRTQVACSTAKQETAFFRQEYARLR